MRFNGTFTCRTNAEPTVDPETGFMVKGSPLPSQRGCECQIEHSIPARQIIGTDGQKITYTYDVFIPKYYNGDISIGDVVELMDSKGNLLETISVLGVDTLNRKYIEVWG